MVLVLANYEAKCFSILGHDVLNKAVSGLIRSVLQETQCSKASPDPKGPNLSHAPPSTPKKCRATARLRCPAPLKVTDSFVFSRLRLEPPQSPNCDTKPQTDSHRGPTKVKAMPLRTTLGDGLFVLCTALNKFVFSGTATRIKRPFCRHKTRFERRVAVHTTLSELFAQGAVLRTRVT